MNIIDLLELTDRQKEKGVWFSRIEGKGEYKRWYSNKNLAEHSFYENGEKHGECKLYWDDGTLRKHCFYKNGKLHGECKWYWGKYLVNHKLYKNDIMIKDYFKEKNDEN